MSIPPLISIVDDDLSVRQAVGSLVRSLGLRASTFASADVFLASPILQETACLISDVQMPGMSGLELQKVLKDRNAGLPVIFITGFPEAAVRRRAQAAGAVGFLGKPFDGQAIVDLLDLALQRSGLTD